MAAAVAERLLQEGQPEGVLQVAAAAGVVVPEVRQEDAGTWTWTGWKSSNCFGGGCGGHGGDRGGDCGDGGCHDADDCDCDCDFECGGGGGNDSGGGHGQDWGFCSSWRAWCLCLGACSCLQERSWSWGPGAAGVHDPRRRARRASDAAEAQGFAAG